MKNIKTKTAIIITIVSIIALGIRMLELDHISGDARSCLLKWLNEIIENGRIWSISKPIGDYNFPYLYLMVIISYLPFNHLYEIKAISIIFDYLMAFAIAILTYNLTNKNEKKSAIAYCIAISMPTVILNSSWWGQCDSIYSFFAILSINYLIKQDYKKSILLLGVSFAFKLQAIFLFPLYAFVWAASNKKKFKFYYFFIVLIPIIIAGIPPMLLGRSPQNTYNIYISQTKENGKYVTMNIFNYYTLASDVNKGQILATGNFGLDNSGFIYLAIILLSVFIYELKNKQEMDGKKIIMMAIWSIIAIIFFLPRMHDRYLYIAEILAIVYTMMSPKKFSVLLILESIATVNYIKIYKNTIFTPKILALLYLLSMILIILDIILTERKQKNEENINTRNSTENI